MTVINGQVLVLVEIIEAGGFNQQQARLAILLPRRLTLLGSRPKSTRCVYPVRPVLLQGDSVVLHRLCAILFSSWAPLVEDTAFSGLNLLYPLLFQLR